MGEAFLVSGVRTTTGRYRGPLASLRPDDLADLVVAGDVASMTRAPFVSPKAPTARTRTPDLHGSTIGRKFVNPLMQQRFDIESMPQTAQIVVDEYGIPRENPDALVLRPQQRPTRTIASGRLARQLVPIEVPRREGERQVAGHEHPRDTSLEALPKLPPIWPGGSVTAVNSSGVNDGTISSERAVARCGLTQLARVTSGVSAGVAPHVMDTGSIPATKKLLKRAKLGVGDVDLIGLNEAFAAQALAVLRGLGLPDEAERFNANGGAFTPVHSLGASGARLALTAAMDMRDRQARRRVATMCIGVGQGVAVLLEAARGRR